MNETEYSALRRVEEVEASGNRKLFRVVLEPDDNESPAIICTFESHAELHDVVRCVTPLSFVRHDTNEPIQINSQIKDAALTHLINHMVETDKDLQNSFPAW